MRRIFSAFCAENAAGTAAYLIKEFNQIIVSENMQRIHPDPLHVSLRRQTCVEGGREKDAQGRCAA